MPTSGPRKTKDIEPNDSVLICFSKNWSEVAWSYPGRWSSCVFHYFLPKIENLTNTDLQFPICNFEKNTKLTIIFSKSLQKHTGVHFLRNGNSDKRKMRFSSKGFTHPNTDGKKQLKFDQLNSFINARADVLQDISDSLWHLLCFEESAPGLSVP